jgi:bifunctional non-homologous end joining protein LigD
MLPAPMLPRPGALPKGDQWALELKWDGFRAIVSTEDGLRVRSRRGWNMTSQVPEFDVLPRGLVLDGELVAFNERGAPHWPLLCERMLHGNRSIRISFIAFDLLAVDGRQAPRRHSQQLNRGRNEHLVRDRRTRYGRGGQTA